MTRTAEQAYIETMASFVSCLLSIHMYMHAWPGESGTKQLGRQFCIYM